MADIVVGAGCLGGKGIYAARAFAAGDVVVSYDLRCLTETEYMGLPMAEHLFVHSFGGLRYLYPEPARYVNHSDEPSCAPDFERRCNVALRPIAAGEPITINAGAETSEELRTFLEVFESSLRDGCAPTLTRLVDDAARSWRAGRAARGRSAVVDALLEETPQPLTGVEWLVGTGRWEALCSAAVGVPGSPVHLTMCLKVIRGNWQLVCHHVG